MGFIIGDTITLSNGLTVQNSYASFGLTEVSVRKDESNNSQYTLEGHYQVWVDKTNRTNDKTIIDAGNIRKTITKQGC